MTDTRTILVSENRLFRDGIRHMLEKCRITVVAEGLEIPALLDALGDGAHPDLVIFHLASDQDPESALEIVRGLREHCAQAKLVILADQSVKSILPILVHSGVSAILRTQISSEMLERSLELVLSEHRLFPADIVASVTSGAGAGASLSLGRSGAPAMQEAGEISPGSSSRAPNLTDPFGADLELLPMLSKREQQVVRCLAIGLSNKTIARELNITEGTVKVHVKALLRKLRARNRTQLAIWALRQPHLIGADAGGGLPMGASRAADPLTLAVGA